MNRGFEPYLVLRALCTGVFLSAVAMAALAFAAEPSVTLTAPKEASAGAEIAVEYSEAVAPLDFISIDKAGAGEREYGVYAYTKSGNPVKLRIPDVPGEYQIRYHREGTYAVAGSAPLTVKDVSASIDAPAQVDAGTNFEVTFSGPNNPQDFVSIDQAGSADGVYGTYVYAKAGSPAKLRAPDAGGSYEVRYHLGQSYRVVASRPLTVGKAAANLEAPTSARAGSDVTIAWTGPNNAGDFISIDNAGAAERIYGPYAYTKDSPKLTIRVPEDAGDYVIRYHTGQSYSVIAEQPLKVDAVTATLNGPASAVARSKFEVAWTGPDNPEDYVAIAKPEAPAEATLAYSYTKRGNPARLEAPKEPGKYELRYLTGQKQNILARAAIEVAPGTTPGTLRVTSAVQQEPSFGAVELVLDASGSMLQRLGGERRMELAKKALIELTRDILPESAPFALRVFGHKEANTCRSDLEIALAPLKRDAAIAKIKSIDAKNLAKTPIGDSLLRVKDDLAGAQGTAVVVLVTDGEETCDGDPKAAIQTLRAAGLDVRVNIVGFAINELALKETFDDWARLGGGSYFDAADGPALARAFRASLRVPYEVKQNGKVVATGVVNGDPIELLPGKYEVTVPAKQDRPAREVTIAAHEEAALQLD